MSGRPRNAWRQTRRRNLFTENARRRVADARRSSASATDPLQDALMTLVGSLPLRVIMVDRDIRVLAASKLSASGMGGEVTNLLGRTLFEIDPEYFLPFRDMCARALTGEPVRMPRVRARQGDGSEVWLRTEVSPWRDATGAIGGLISVSIDITDMMDVLEASERSEQRLQMAVEIADLHVWELDYATGAMITAGPTETFFDGSLSMEDIAADTNITIHPDDWARIATAWREAMEADLHFRPEYRINRADGKEVWAACTTKLIRNKRGNPTRLIGAMQDVTARKQAEGALVKAKEEAEAANRAKSSFLATMSHEIRTPLNGVLGMAQAMAADDLSPVQRGRLETVRQSGESLLVILNDLLDLSKIEAGKLDLEVVDFELGALATSVRDAFSGVAERKGVPLELEFVDGARGLYRGDSTRLRQILSNLLSNALKFTQAGEVRLSVERRGGAVIFQVSDTGIGIPPSRLPHLFNKFEQADSSTTRRFGGTGLGLAICRELAALMGGRIEARSEEDAGSTFELILPLSRVGEEVEAPGPGAPQDDAFEPVASLRVLAAEDNSVNQLVLRTLLQQAGLDPVIVGDGHEALAAWREHPWDVILMDVQMPVMDGPTATRAIRDEEAATGRARTPILALTANAMSHQLEDYMRSGMDGVIQKPIRVDQLFAALQAALGSEAEAA